MTCHDCQRHPRGYYYMVADDVWAATGLAPDGGQLCLSCLETRLGRALQVTDFLPTTQPTAVSPGSYWLWHQDRMYPRCQWRDLPRSWYAPPDFPTRPRPSSPDELFVWPPADGASGPEPNDGDVGNELYGTDGSTTKRRSR